MIMHERFHAVEPFALTVRHVEVHWAFLTFFRLNLLAALSPRRLFTARPFIASFGAAMRAAGDRATVGTVALDLYLTRFLHANRYPPRIKSGAGFRSETLWPARQCVLCIDIPTFKP
jgi:hypothetical protein